MTPQPVPTAAAVARRSRDTARDGRLGGRGHPAGVAGKAATRSPRRMAWPRSPPTRSTPSAFPRDGTVGSCWPSPTRRSPSAPCCCGSRPAPARRPAPRPRGQGHRCQARRRGPGSHRRQRRGQRHTGRRPRGRRAGSRRLRADRNGPSRARDQGGRPGRRRRQWLPGAGLQRGVSQGAQTTPIRGPAATLVRFMDESRSIPTATSFRTLSVDLLASSAPRSRPPARSSPSPT